MKTTQKIAVLLESWEETYKKGQLTLWVFLSLQDGDKCVDEIKEFIENKSNGIITCEEQSLYRALRKYEHIDVVTFDYRKGNKGPDRKYYTMTSIGQQLFQTFVKRNIQLFYSTEIKQLLNI
jgi:PadR family transcriptional regulator PadR